MKKSPSLFRRWRDRDREKKDQRLASPATSAAPTERLAVPEGDREKELDEVDHDRHETINSAQERQDEVDTSSCSVKDTETYHWRRTLESLEDVGQLRVHLIGASGLYGADFGGKSDPFAVVRVGDVEFTSATVAKTTEPAWDEEFLFQVDDICQILHVSVWDRDRFHDPELLGRVALSLLEIKEDDEKGTVSTLSLALKDKKLSGRARGRHPQIRLGLRLTWNRGRAAIRTLFRPELQPPAPPFKKHVFIGNVQRVRRLLHAAEQFAKFIQSCFEWEHPSRSIKAFGAFEVAAYFFEAYMVPLAFLVFIFGYPLFAAKFAVVDWLDPYSELESNDDDEEDEVAEDKSTPSDKLSLSERYRALQEVTAYVQNTLGQLGSTVERIKNVLIFTTPFLTWIAVAFLSCAVLILYLLPLRLLIMLWGVHKFSKKLLRPRHKSTSEVWNFLSGVPDDVCLEQCRPLSLEDEALLREEEEERQRRERSAKAKIAKKVSSFFQKSPSASVGGSRENVNEDVNRSASPFV